MRRADLRAPESTQSKNLSSYRCCIAMSWSRCRSRTRLVQHGSIGAKSCQRLHDAAAPAALLTWQSKIQGIAGGGVADAGGPPGVPGEGGVGRVTAGAALAGAGGVDGADGGG